MKANEQEQISLLYRDIEQLKEERDHLHKGITQLINQLEIHRDIQIDAVMDITKEQGVRTHHIEYYKGRSSFLQSVLNKLENIMRY